ncbi:C-type mannose receptor 2-like [Physella acuta]|uniref:C-type mannose receptor 2-like n=1 Tax=Physella acuta TaxID=109671 RepID=UPI0027DDA124|nr:C-type mannose receptor 2-like [Physella acuta]
MVSTKTMKAMMTLIVCISAVNIRLIDGAIACPNSDWIESETHCYHIYQSQSVWAVAQNYCSNFGANLASLSSQDEIKFLNKTLNGKFQTMWIGFYKLSSFDAWRWVDKTKVQLTKLEPDVPREREDCAATYHTAVWHDYPCNTKLYGLCEKNVPPATFDNGSSECPNRNWFRFTQNCYYVHKSSIPWSEAQKRCSAFGANLASLHSEEEITFLTSQILRAGEITWIGLHKTQTNTLWRWVDGTKVNLTRWDVGQPEPDRQECVSVYDTLDSWYIDSCNNKHYGLCKKARTLTTRNNAVRWLTPFSKDVNLCSRHILTFSLALWLLNV